MIQFFCDNCDQSINPVEALGPGVPAEYNKTFEWKHSSGIVILISLAKEHTTQHFCKSCMWMVIKDMLDEIGPETNYYEQPDDLYPEDVDRDSSGQSESVPELRIEDLLPRTGPYDGESITERIGAEIRRHWGGPWAHGGSKGSAVRRTRWPLSTSKAKRRQSRSGPRVLP